MILRDGWKWAGRALLLGVIVAAPGCVGEDGGEEGEDIDCVDGVCDLPQEDELEEAYSARGLCLPPKCKECPDGFDCSGLIDPEDPGDEDWSYIGPTCNPYDPKDPDCPPVPPT